MFSFECLKKVVLVHFQILSRSCCSFEGGIAKHYDPSVHIRLQTQIIEQITIRYFSSYVSITWGLNCNMGIAIVARLGGRRETCSDDDMGIMP